MQVCRNQFEFLSSTRFNMYVFHQYCNLLIYYSFEGCLCCGEDPKKKNLVVSGDTRTQASKSQNTREERSKET